MSDFKKLLQTYEDLERQLKVIKQKIVDHTTIGNKRISVDPEGITISVSNVPPLASATINFSFNEIREIFKFLKEKGILEDE